MNRSGIAGRFSTRRFGPEPLASPQEDIPQTSASADAPAQPQESGSWTVYPHEPAEPAAPVSAAVPSSVVVAAADRSDKLLDAKVRLHRRLLEELNLSALEKLPEAEMREHVQQLVSQYVVKERLALNQQELNEFVAEIIDEMTGLGPLEPLLKDPSINDILINGHESTYVERGGLLEPVACRFKDEAHLLRIINKIVSAVGRRVDEIASALRRAPARRFARERRRASRRCRWSAGVDPQILEEAV